MLPGKLHLELVTPERRVLVEDVQEVMLPGEVGYFGVLPGHAPLLSSLEIGEIMYRVGTRKEFLAISTGFAEILPERIIILVNTAEKAKEIDSERARGSLGRAQERLRKWESNLDFWRARASLQKAFIRIRVSGKIS